MYMKGGDNVLTKKELAEILKVTVVTVDRQMKKGMPYMKLSGGSVRFDLEEVKQWMKGE